jgi:hypothetical protein
MRQVSVANSKVEQTQGIINVVSALWKANLMLTLNCSLFSAAYFSLSSNTGSEGLVFDTFYVQACSICNISNND